ncbi:Rad and Gem related GTP binding protein 1 [Paragonimus westermani]|uniref:Rad and Gem related GTP binding protein 1 n=1 Tax=Paragonimus westermani TaxID=34504 RepID=A0A5J4NU23_9TREM|nr:Rad and Gem related GTP binding protein 1 [Paragonimus westermani]
MEFSDDFERFCQIAQRSPRDSLSPSCQNYDPGRRQTYGDHLSSPAVGNVKRSSSFRESRHAAHKRAERSSGNISTTRSPTGADRNYSQCSSDDRSPTEVGRVPVFCQYNPNKPKSTTGEVSHYEPGSQDNFRGSLASPTLIRADRNRAGSMKETRRTSSTPKAGYRPSAPAVYPTFLSPDYRGHPHSPGRHSDSAADEDNLVTVRRFQRKKDGQIISKGDQNMPQEELYKSINPSDLYRASICLPRPSMSATPAIYTDDLGNHSDSSLSDNEVVEIPAITTTLVNSPTMDYGQRPPLSRSPASTLHSPNALRPELRNRSRSWAVVFQSNQGSPQSCSPPNADMFNLSELLTVQVLGASRVGKTSLCMQFQTSESLDVTLDSAMEDEQVRVVTVEVNNVKFHLNVIDTNLIEEEFPANSESLVVETADAYVVVYAIDDRSSFLTARSIVSHLLGHSKRSSAIMLTANKSDLVRTRAVPEEEGRNLATIYSCPYYEISTALNHRVDELLVGTVMTIQERRRLVDKERDRLERMANCSGNPHGSFAVPGHRRSLTALKSPTSNIVKFFQKKFSRKNKQEHGLL